MRRHGGLSKWCGCTPRQWTKCAQSWHLAFCHGKDATGRKVRHRVSLHRFADRPAGNVMSRSAPTLAEPTLADVADRYLRDYARRDTRKPHAVRPGGPALPRPAVRVRVPAAGVARRTARRARLPPSHQPHDHVSLSAFHGASRGARTAFYWSSRKRRTTVRRPWCARAMSAQVPHQCHTERLKRTRR